MAQNLDLEEQEQLEQLKHFWKRYGTPILWLLTAVLAAFAAWTGYRYWEQKQGGQASALFDEVDRAAQAGDVAKLEQAFNDIRDRYGRTAPAQHAGLLAGKVFYEKGKPDAAKAALTWTADKASDEGLRALARLRLVGILVQEKAYDEALRLLGVAVPPQFDALVADRRGDVYALQGKNAEAIAEYTRAYKAMEPQLQYRRLVGVKLNALGVDPDPQSTATSAAVTTAPPSVGGAAASAAGAGAQP